MNKYDISEQRRLIVRGLQWRISILAILIIILSVAGFMAWYQLSIRRIGSNFDKDPFSYENQIKKLNSIQRNIANLADFVAEQKRQLEEYQKQAYDLQTKYKELKPVFEAEEKTIQTILQAEWERRKQDIWINRGYSFAAGIAASLIAALILYSIKYIRTKRER
jgi:septal ring factor EnvC (AmiA/AmiB activator)